MAYNSPPRDLVLDNLRWLRDEIYSDPPNRIGLVPTPLDEVGIAAWVGDRYPQLWNHLTDKDVMVKHQKIKEQIYRDIYKIIFPEAEFPEDQIIPEPQPQPDQQPLTRGQLKIKDNIFAYGDEYENPLFCHFGEAFSAWTREPDRVEKQLDVIYAAGYDGIRFWDILGYYPVWYNKAVTPIGFYNKDSRWIIPTDNYYDKLSEFINIVHSKGLKVFWSRGDMNGIRYSDRVRHFENLANLVKTGRVPKEAIAIFEGLNEPWQNGADSPQELIELVNIFKQANPDILCTLGCPEGASEEIRDVNYWTPKPADLPNIHGYRGGAAEDMIRHVFGMIYEIFPNTDRNFKQAFQGEPAGPGDGVTVGQINSTEELTAIAAMSLIAKQAWVYMSGYGVFFDGPIDEQPGFWAVPKIRAMLPKDVMKNKFAYHGGRSEAIITSATGFTPAASEGPARIDQTQSDGKCAAVAYGGRGRKIARFRRSFIGKVISTRTFEVREISVQSGTDLLLGNDYAYVIIGDYD